jgi:AraC-like DNA-binding protein
MKVTEKGVLPVSKVYFHTASKTARSLFFHILCCGNFACDLHYKVKRNSYDSFLFLLVVKGSGYLVKDGKRVPLKQGSLTLVDCYKPHEYGTDMGWKILWCHFNSEQAAEWYQRIEETSSCSIQLLNPTPFVLSLEKLISLFEKNGGANEAFTNKIIVNLLSEFLIPKDEEIVEPGSFEDLLGYINEHLAETISIPDLAEKACLSPFHFIRTFKAEIGYTPHEYILNTRVNAAKFYLKTTKNSLKDIVYSCGFSNESSFSNTFKRLTGFTPVQYRKTESI